MCLSFNYIISSFIYIVNTVHYKIHYHEKIYLLLKIEKNIILCYNYLIKEAFFMAIKDKVLELLDDNKGKYLSGEQLADTLGCTLDALPAEL